MAIKFNQSKGSAQKEKIESYVYTGKENHKVRLVGDLLPRYLYWVKGENNKNQNFRVKVKDDRAKTAKLFAKSQKIIANQTNTQPTKKKKKKKKKKKTRGKRKKRGRKRSRRR